ncbi:WXG100 family type VII secretion target [Leucobacter coleopterorum]|uniref:ESAT-6-like protein n=1 Tax=Leucobacter coleopterorum TaxID=2714933 RepID=A0ABX6JYE8_9MICO|nr:WXG100 family type VII secretion target [Leucobacter coleopterorum]QIM19347.1 WXG100 family type VII secretion target [Leucobacter coleopterorum]
MANTISAEEGALRKGQQAVADAKQGIDAQTKAVRNKIQEMSGYWKGAAAGAFTQLMNSWDTETVKLNNVLIELERSMKDTETDQAQTEDSHQQAIRNLGAMMSGA